MKKEKLREIRKQKGFTQEAIAKLLGYEGKAGYSRFESGKVKVSLEKSLKLKEILKLTDEEYNDIFISKKGYSQTPQWIDVNDKLPDSTDWVVVKRKYKGFKALYDLYIAAYVNGDWIDDIYHQKIMESDVCKITHWTPLPQENGERETQDGEKMGLKKLIKEKGYTQQSFGEALGVDQTAVSNWCNGINLASIANVKKMADVLGITLDEVMKAMEEDI